MTPPPPAASATAGRVAGPLPQRRRLPGGLVARPSRDLVGRVGAASGGLLVRAFAGRRVIGLLAFALIGLVFLQVSLLKLNTQISGDAEKTQLLVRQTAEQRSLLAKLDASQRVTGAAGGLGLVMPAPDQVCYLKASDSQACSVSDSAIGQGSDPLLDPNGLTGDPSLVQAQDTGAAQSDPTAVDTTGTTGVTDQTAPSDQTHSQSPVAQADPGGLSAGGQ